MCWPSFFIGLAAGSVLALAVWALTSVYHDLRAEDAARAASQRGEGDR